MGLPRERLVIPPEMEGRIREISESMGEPAQAIVDRALAEYLADLEDLLIAESRLKDLEAGRSSTVSLEDVMAKYGLADQA
jgi:RHH-type rel operon transcriptional repressor/antitoxin RelB